MLPSACLILIMSAILGQDTPVLAEGPRLVQFDFAGFRATVCEMDDEALLRLTEDEVVEAYHGRAAFLESATVYDGVVWGRDEGNLAAQWYCRTRDELDPNWTRFDRLSSEPNGIPFPATARVMGRTNLFAWHGHCHLVVTVRRVDDPTAPWFATDIGEVQEVFAFSNDWRRAMHEHISFRRAST